MKFRLISILLVFCSFTCLGQEDRIAFDIKKIYDIALTQNRCYDRLESLTTIGARLAGSAAAASAVEFCKQEMLSHNMDKVYLQECTVPNWRRGDKEVVKIINSERVGTQTLNAVALGNSVGTGAEGLVGDVVEVQSLDEVSALGSQVKGKIVFYNRALDRTQLKTFNAYGGAVDQRVFGASKAAEFGAIAVIVRSMTTAYDDVPHTGTLVYDVDQPKIPAVAISTNDANMLSGLLKHTVTRIFIRTTCYDLPPAISYNVIGEIKGSAYPDEIILVGGHLDSWDLGEGAHDDGSGCVHAMEVINIFEIMGYKPQRTIRCVMFMNEENGQAGAIKYRDESDANGEFHVAAIESDAGGFTPRGFSFDALAETVNKQGSKIKEWSDYLEPYDLKIGKGGSGADINRLKPQGGMLFGFRPDSQRYFDYHHTVEDTFDKVNERELALGAAAMASLVYLIDQNGINR